MTTTSTPAALPASKEAEAVDLADAIVNFVADWAAEDDEDTMRSDLERMFKRFAALSTAIPAGDGVPPGMVEALRNLTNRAENFWALIQGEYGVRLSSEDHCDHNVYEFFAALETANALLSTTASTAGDRK